MMKSFVKFAIPVLVLGLAASACAKKNPEPGDPRADRAGGSMGLGESNAALQPIYFEFDQYVVSDAEKEKVKRAAKFVIAAGETIKGVLLEGHADDRGSADYNFVLGQKRADSVLDALAAVGIARDKLSTTSYGEEFPVVVGASNESWALNRRVEFVLLTGSDDPTSKKRRK
jgi:peptidoglycan-associated lipoprotein